MNAVNSANKLPGLQLLRAAAAMLVLVGHVIAEAEHYFGLGLPGDPIPWTRGVDIFFVISGFVITLSAARYAGQPAAFLWRRVLRVVPLYWLFTTLMVVALVLVPGGAKDTVFDPMQILTSYGFIPYERLDGRVAPVLSLGWTLNYEVFFYALAALCLALPRPLFMLGLLMFGLAVIGWLYDFSNAQLSVWTNPIILEFTMGIALARLWQRGCHLPHGGLAVVGVVAGGVLLVILDQTTLPRFIAAGVPATLIVAAGTLLCPNRQMQGLIWGDSSYALYLSHRFVLRGATLLLLPLLPAGYLGAVTYVVTVCALALAVGVLTHVYIEKPMLRALAAPRTPVPA